MHKLRASILSVCAALPLAVFVQTANAALINVDWQTAGDGLMIRDTNTDLEWLRLTETLGMNYAGVTGQIGTGGTFDGLRFATNNEVVALFATYFSIDLGADALRDVPAYIDPNVRTASETLSNGVSGGTDAISGPNANYRLVGFTGQSMQNGSPFVLGAATKWSDTEYYTVKDPLAADDIYPAGQPGVGAYLVRTTAEAPVPVAGGWLLGWGLLALSGFVRRGGR